MAKRFNPPPNWPVPPSGWAPDATWRPDPSWGEPPPGWDLWVDDDAPSTRLSTVAYVAIGMVASLVLVGAVNLLGGSGDDGDDPGTVAQAEDAAGVVALEGAAADDWTETPAEGSVDGLATDSVDTLVAGAAVSSALAALGLLEVKGRAPKTGYDRAEFGQTWADVDRNGCDTRNDILRRDLTDLVLKEGTRGCKVLAGTLAEPYRPSTIAFTQGPDTSAAVQIDHVVALSDAWQKGAQALDRETRTRFANDPVNLLAVDGPLNQQKGDGDAATWLPPNKAFRCEYVARQVTVKAAYGLWVTEAERAAIAKVLQTCPDQPVLPGTL